MSIDVMINLFNKKRYRDLKFDITYQSRTIQSLESLHHS